MSDLHRYFLGAALILLSSACTPSSVGADFYRNYSEEDARIKKYSLEDQYQIYRYGSDVIEPPDVGLGAVIAQKGQQVVPFLLTKLDEKTDSDDLRTRDILMIFEFMQQSNYYDVRSDKNVMDHLERAVNTLDHSPWAAVCRRTLDDIKQTPR